MKAVDTNVLVRILVDDSSSIHQSKLARQFAKKSRCLFIPQVVQAELVWVLETAYDLNKSEVVKILQHLYENEAFVLQYDAHFYEALTSFQVANADFSDCLILAASNEEKCEVVTFDKKFSKLPGVKLLIE